MNEEYKICPRCQIEINADSRICKKCLFNLRDVEIKTRISDAHNKTFVDKATRLKIQSNFLRKRFIFLSVISVYICIFIFGNLLYVNKYRVVPTLPISSNVFEVTAIGESWPSEYGQSTGMRNLNQSFDLNGMVLWEHQMKVPQLFNIQGLSTNIIGNKNFIIYALVNGELNAISKATGQLVWSKKIPGLLDSTPIIIENQLYFPQRDGIINAIDIATGQTIWQTKTSDVFLTGISIVEGMIYANSLDKIYFFDANNGDLIWSKKIQNLKEFPATAVSANDEILIISTSSLVIHLDRKTGEVLHKHRTSWVEHTYTEGDNFYVFSKNEVGSISKDARGYWWDKVPTLRFVWGQLMAWNMAPLIPRDENNWITALGKGSFRRNIIHLKIPAINQDSIFTVHYDGSIKSIDKKTGAYNWQVDYENSVTDPIITQSGLVIGIGNDLVTLDTDTGKEMNRIGINRGKLNQIAIIDNELIAVIDDRIIINID